MAFTVWAQPEQAIGFNIVLDAIKTHGDMNAPFPPGRRSSVTAIQTSVTGPGLWQALCCRGFCT